MTAALPLIPNAAARRLFLARHALAEAPTGLATGAGLAALIDRIGFVQIDSINTVERAHHMILWSRRRSYRPRALAQLMERDRGLFEHWTHDASVLPIGLFAHWRHRFDRDRARLIDRWTGWQRAGFHENTDTILQQIADHGPVTSSDVGAGEARGSGGWWDWHPSKAALEYLWRVGEVSVLRRDGFQKVYDLTERVIPPQHRQARPSPEETTQTLCDMALDRLGFATAGEVAAYWAAVPPDAARDWAAREGAAGRLIWAEVEGADGARRKALIRPDTLDRPLPEPPAMLRILSPFDPALRDRKRAERLFGFAYRIEVFVPEAQRRYGYYVFPILEGARLIGRIDVKAQRDQRTLNVRAVWPEAGLRMGKGRLRALEAELNRLARFAGCDQVIFAADWLRAA